MSLHKYHDVTLAANDAAAYTPCLRPHWKLILTDILLKISEINPKTMYIQKIEKSTFWSKLPKGPFLHDPTQIINYKTLAMTV